MGKNDSRFKKKEEKSDHMLKMENQNETYVPITFQYKPRLKE